MTLTLPISAHALGTILFVAVVVILSGLVYLATRQVRQEDAPKDWLSTMRQRMGLTGLHPGLVTGLAVIWGVLFLALLAGMFWVLYGVAERAAAVTEQEGRDLRWYLLTLTAITASLGAVISLPFTLIRVALNRRQTETAEQGHITDRINTAVQGLGAEKVVKERVFVPIGSKSLEDISPSAEIERQIRELPVRGTRGTWDLIETTQPNLEVRIGAIYALERIAQDSDRDHVQIMEILCAYIRQNAPAPAEDDWPELEMRESENDGPLEADWEERLEAFREAQEKAKAGLKVREDIQVALTVIGRRSEKQRRLEAGRGVEAAFPFDVPCPEYDGPEDGHDQATLNTYRKKLREWEKALRAYDGYRLDLSGADLRGTDLSHLDLNGARLHGARLQGADLMEARLQGANLGEARLQGADLVGARLQGANLGEARLQGARLVGARLQGANLGEARLQGARLVGARFDPDTALTAATLRGAAVRAVDFTSIPQITGHLEGIFGDGSVTLPEGCDWPAHWPRHELEFRKFIEEWRKWQADREGYTPPDPPNAAG
ncbi:pentapeptide repeat-containing protein [Roseovarius ramblicola]|uniref:Pentapeptide repeat-containing protein n=1 Tax=Roseovarius ramblicola TaxID=2022336 RepID=A0ABV5I0N7_9RHOB